MNDIIIRRCPINQSIDVRAREIRSTLFTELGLKARIMDGAPGEFSILVDGVPVLQRSDDCPPCVEEVEAAVQHAIPATVAASVPEEHSHDSWLSRPCDEV